MEVIHIATYTQIQAYIKEHYGYTAKSCWIAHMKEECGLQPKISPRRYSKEKRVHPCPTTKQADLLETFKYFKMI